QPGAAVGGRPGNEVHDAGRQPRLLQQLEQVVVGVRGRGGRLPYYGAAHDRGGRGEVPADGREVEGGDRVHEPLQRTILELVPRARGGDRLRGVQLLGVVEVEAPEIDEFARRVDLRLVRGLGLAQHRRRVHDGAVARGEEVG